MIELNSVRAYLLEKKATTEETPFGPEALVFKVKGKMFALVAWNDRPLTISLKCDPDEAMALREQYEGITAGYHLNKRHWNTVTLDGSIPNEEVRYMIDQSYQLVVKKLPKKVQSELN